MRSKIALKKLVKNGCGNLRPGFYFPNLKLQRKQGKRRRAMDVTKDKWLHHYFISIYVGLCKKIYIC
jgi:hypothetical protein